VSANLGLLGITDEMVEVMRMERSGKAPWLHGDRESVSRVYGPRRRYPFKQTKVGRSFFVPFDECAREAVIVSVYGGVQYVRRVYRMKFSTHITGKGIRVKRVA